MSLLSKSKWLLQMLLCAILFSSAALLLVNPGRVTAAVQTNRIYGQDRYETAVKISQYGWGSAHTVLLTRGDDFADALAGVPLAHQYNAPILLTPSDINPDRLNEHTKAELARLQAAYVIILGGTAAVSQAVEDELKNLGYLVERVGGADRFDTAARIAGMVAPGGSVAAVVVNGFNFQDALVASPYAARAGIPLLLVEPGSIPSYTSEAISLLGITSTIVVGYPAAVNDDVYNRLPLPDRYGNPNWGHYSNAVVAAYRFQPNGEKMFLATGRVFADALTGAVLAARYNSGILLVGDSVPVEVKRYIDERNISSLTIFGGPAAVSTAVESELRNEPVDAPAREVVIPVTIIQDLIPVGRKNRPGKSMAPLYITIHDTGNTSSNATARMHAIYLKGDSAANRPASWHFTVDSVEIYQHLPLNEHGWHAGDKEGPGNMLSIGIEICENSGGNRALAETHAAWLTAKLLIDLNIPLSNVRQHSHWSSSANCPRVLRSRPGGWTGFLADVEQKMRLLNEGQLIGTPILGHAQATIDQAQNWARSRGAHQRFIDIAPFYWHYGQLTGIRPEVLYAQSAKETAFGNYGGAVTPDQNNWAGIKIVSPTGDKREDHESFPTPEDGVRAHFNHVCAYTGLNPVGQPHGRYYVVLALPWAGTIRHVEEFSAKWAPSSDYGYSIINHYLNPMLTY